MARRIKQWISRNDQPPRFSGGQVGPLRWLRLGSLGFSAIIFVVKHIIVYQDMK
jgi:hypothetical protein